MDPLFEVKITTDIPKGSTLLHTISRQIKQAILAGRLQYGVKLPSTRGLSKSLNVSRNTVIAVYDTLIYEGYIEARQGGTYVVFQAPLKTPVRSEPITDGSRLTTYWREQQHSETLPQQSAAKFDFRVGVPSSKYFPFETWRKLLAHSARFQQKEGYSGVSPEGYTELRSAIAKHISVSRAVGCEANDIVVTSGAQQALDILARILVTPGVSKVAMDTPGYPMAKVAFQAAGAEIVGIEADEQGMKVQDIADDVTIVYVTPSHQFPLGMALSASRRGQLLEMAKQRQISVIEDDYDSEFRLFGGPIDALKTLDYDDNVFYVGTFSKCMLPDVRMGFVVLPQWAKKAFIKAKFQADWFCNVLTQDTLANFISQGHLTRYLKRMRKVYQQRYNNLFDACEKIAGQWLQPIAVNTGVHLSAFLDSKIDAYRLSEHLLRYNVSICSLKHFATDDACPNGLVFGFGCIDSQDIEQGVKQIVTVIESGIANKYLI